MSIAVTLLSKSRSPQLDRLVCGETHRRSHIRCAVQTRLLATVLSAESFFVSRLHIVTDSTASPRIVALIAKLVGLTCCTFITVISEILLH